MSTVSVETAFVCIPNRDDIIHRFAMNSQVPTARRNALCLVSMIIPYD